MATNSIFMRFPNGLAKALTLSYDDGVEQDYRLIEIMKRNGLCGTFNIPTSRYIEEGFTYPPEKKWGQNITKAQATALYDQPGIEPALHALTHAHLESLPTAQVAYEVIKDRENLEEQFSRIVRGMAYPYGTYSDEAVETLRTCGIAYCRTVKSTESFALPTDWLRLHPTCHHVNPRLPELTKKFVEGNPNQAQAPWLFYLWGHSYEFERDNNWDVIETFSEQIGGKDDIWYATNIEIYDYVENFKRLIFSLDLKHVQNPTSYDFWFILRDKMIHIAPGETLLLD